MKRPIERGQTAERVSANIRRLRQRRGLSQAELAAQLNEVTGRELSEPAVMNMELGRRRVDVDDLIAVAIVLEVSPHELLLAPPATERTALLPLLGPLADDEWTVLHGKLMAVGEHLVATIEGMGDVLELMAARLARGVAE